MPEKDTTNALWYALRSHPHKEEMLYRQALSQGIEIFYPCLRVKPVNPRSRKIRPYFPGYMFVHSNLDLSGISLFQWMPYSAGLVAFGGEPAIVPEPIIQTLQKRLETEALEEKMLSLEIKPGERIIITDGPFAGFEGIFDLQLSGSERVRILLKLLNQQNLRVELNARQIQKKKEKAGNL